MDSCEPNRQANKPGNDGEQVVETYPPLASRGIVLTGPTAAGKSAVALELAERLGGEVLSVDSIAVYTGMDIGTAKPTRSEQRRVRHHLIDLVEPNQSFSVACYLRAAHQRVAELERRGKVPIFVGGTPMFLKGIMRGFDPGPPADWQFRQEVEADVAVHGAESLHKRLSQVDPLAAHRIDIRDVRRMIRALEVAYQAGVPLSHRQLQFDRSPPELRGRVFATKIAREQLHQRIDQRVEAMFERGLVAEVRGLLARYGTLSRTASQAVGYREVIESAERPIMPHQLSDLVAAHTRQLARRQETWFRSLSEIQPIAVAKSFDAHHICNEIVKSVRL